MSSALLHSGWWILDISGHNAGMFACCLSISQSPGFPLPGWRRSDKEGMPGQPRPRPAQFKSDTGTEKSSSINSGASLTTGHSLVLRVNILNIIYYLLTTRIRLSASIIMIILTM